MDPIVILANAPNEFGLIISSPADGLRPSSNFGSQLTPAQNAYGATNTVINGFTLTDDAWELEIIVRGVGISTVARDCVIQLGIDPSGGNTPTITYDLVVGPAVSGLLLTGGVFFRLPYFVKAGSSIICAAAVNSSNLATLNVACRAFCRPSRPDLLRKGTYIDTFGVTLASSSGTAITPGTSSEGAYTAIGSALTRSLFWLDFGFGLNNATSTAEAYDVDIAIGDASNKKIAIPNAPVIVAVTEQLGKAHAGRYCKAAVGDILYARAQASATPDSGISISIIGVGG